MRNSKGHRISAPLEQDLPPLPNPPPPFAMLKCRKLDCRDKLARMSTSQQSHQFSGPVPTLNFLSFMESPDTTDDARQLEGFEKGMQCCQTLCAVQNTLHCQECGKNGRGRGGGT